jgi:hypothetical protein
MTPRRYVEPLPYRPLTPEEVELLTLLRKTNGPDIAGLARYCGVELDADTARRIGELTETMLADERMLAEMLVELWVEI